MASFLKTGKVMEFEEDIRGEECPETPVFSMEELRALQPPKPVQKPKKDDANAALLSFPGCDIDITRPISELMEFDNDPRDQPQPTTDAKSEPPMSSSSSSSSSASDGPNTGGGGGGAIDISKLDIRVGVITKAWLHEEADSLFCEEIDIGEASPRQIASGLRAHYALEDLEGRRVLVLANLKARKLMGFASHGMVLCASDGGGGAVAFLEPPEGAAVGERVTVAGYDGPPATENQILKKKMLEQIFPDLRTDADGVATYRGVPLCTSAGSCRAPLPNAAIA